MLSRAVINMGFVSYGSSGRQVCTMTGTYEHKPE